MKLHALSFIIILVVSITACNPASIPGEPFQRTSPTSINPTASLTATAVPATQTALPPSPTPTVTFTATQIPTSTPTPIPPTPTPTSTQDSFADRLLPDLQTQPPSDLQLLYNSDTRRALIRFTNAIWNSGPGVLELVGVPNQAEDQIRVSQRVFAIDREVFDDYEVGEFIYHDQHLHWHLEQFAVYELWSVDDSGALEALVASGGKISYCVMDGVLAEAELPGLDIPTRASYTHCEGDVQGLSVGWVDTYEYHLPGQWVEVTPLEDGLYAIVSTVNPDQLLFEDDFYNNTGVTYFEIQDLRLGAVGEQIFEEEELPNPNSNLEPQLEK